VIQKMVYIMVAFVLAQRNVHCLLPLNWCGDASSSEETCCNSVVFLTLGKIERSEKPV
jgi:hypothetical protein